MDNRMSQHEHSGACCKSTTTYGVEQSMKEMEFERGIWAAALNNDIPRLKMLLSKKNADPSEEDLAGYTALHYAARAGHLKVCQILVEAKANVNARTRAGRATPLHRATKQGHTQIVQLLLEHGADPNIRDADGKTALSYTRTDNNVPTTQTAQRLSSYEFNWKGVEK